MSKAVLLITRHKKLLRKVRYIYLRLGRDAFVFPQLARAEIRSAGFNEPLYDVEIPDEKLEQRNVKYLTEKFIPVYVGKNIYSTSIYDELLVLNDWLKHGVADSEYEEFMQRVLALKSELEPIAHYMFDTPIKELIFQFLSSLKDIRRSQDTFVEKNRNLTLMGKERSKEFKEALMEILRKPRELEEIVALTKVNESNARRWLLKLESQGLITKTRKRVGIGRPKNIYYLSQRLALGNNNEEKKT